MDALKLALAALCGCTITSIDRASSSTEGVPVDELTFTVVSVSSDGALADAHLQMFVHGSPGSLGKDDVLRLVGGSGAATAFVAVPDDLDFEAKLATADTALSIEFVRSGVVAKTIPVPLPPPFAPVAAMAAKSRASGITLSWTAAPAFQMEIVATGAPCLPEEGFTAHLEPDTGAFEIQPADMITVSGDCEITVAFTRGAQQTQARTLTVPTTP